MSIYIDGKLVAGVKSGGSIPAGCIIGYNGELNNIPLGYALCNGQNGTPDLTDKFIVGDSPTKYEFCYIMKQNLPTSETAKIYGVTWDGSSTTKWKRIKDSALFPEPVPYVSGATNYGSPFDNIYPWKGMSVSGRQGGSMVSIPKFYYVLQQDGNSLTIQISNTKHTGFYTSPAHMDRGDGFGERDIVYVGRYHSANDYRSKTHSPPAVYNTRATTREQIHALGSSIWQFDFTMWITIQLLYLVEYADWDSQKVIGFGGNEKLENVGYTDIMPYHTGTTQSSAESEGAGTQYRHIEGLWENTRDWLDGCRFDGKTLYAILNPLSFSDTSGGLLVGTLCNGYPTKFSVSNTGYFPLFYGSTAGGNENTYSSDVLCDEAASGTAAFVGGYGKYKKLGLFYLADFVSTGAGSSVGCRIMELP